MHNLTKTSLAFAGALLLSSIATSALAREGNSVITREAVQSTQATTTTPPADDLLARRKPRVPGGSGCDDPDDLIEHPECRPGNAAQQDDQLARRKPRVPGGSGCDDPDDLIEHPECRPGNAVQKEEQQARSSITQDVFVVREAG
jgi:hypothetical protein